MNTENLSTLKIHKLTQAQYDRELAAGNIDENALYLTPDEEIKVPTKTSQLENDSGYVSIEDVNKATVSATTIESTELNTMLEEVLV